MSPNDAATICTGSEIFISFCTPEREVKVDEPVKFMARKDETAPITRNHAMISIIWLPNKFRNKNNMAISHPTVRPFNENLLKGIQGKNIGVKTHPAK